MKAVVQRVTRGRVSVEGETRGEIALGLVVLLGVAPEDNEEMARELARKVAALRIFGDAQGKMNLSLRDVGGSALVISQFTLFADTRKGHRPSFIGAAPPELAKPLCDRFVNFLQAEGIPTQEGEFGAHMLVEIDNDGPVTIVLEVK
jgi:D-tyrosyl-tRNA(Tyr) deacylase